MAPLQTAVVGLVGFTAAEAQMLAATAAGSGEPGGGATRGAAAPLLAHIAEFKRQRGQRLEAIRDGQAPPSFLASFPATLPGR